jgi:predicted DNA-binding transcriptional regulator AlpA
MTDSKTSLPATTVEPLWGPKEVAAYLCVPVQTLYQWRRRKYGPKAYPIGKHLRWEPGEVRDWVKRQDGTP